MPRNTDTRAAVAAHVRNAAHRAATDPDRLARAARITCAGLERGLIPPEQATQLAAHIARVVDALPPLTEAQRARLAALLGATRTTTRGVVVRSARRAVSPQ